MKKNLLIFGLILTNALFLFLFIFKKSSYQVGISIDENQTDFLNIDSNLIFRFKNDYSVEILEKGEEILYKYTSKNPAKKQGILNFQYIENIHPKAYDDISFSEKTKIFIEFSEKIIEKSVYFFIFNGQNKIEGKNFYNPLRKTVYFCPDKILSDGIYTIEFTGVKFKSGSEIKGFKWNFKVNKGAYLEENCE